MPPQELRQLVQDRVFSAETLMHLALKDIKTFVNTEFAENRGPSKQFASQDSLLYPARGLLLT
jgi:hypothetical protein